VVKKAGRAKLGVAGAVAAVMIGLVAVLSAFIIAELALIYQKYGLTAMQRIREAHEKEKELLKIYHTDYHPLIAAALAALGVAPGREPTGNISVVGLPRGYYTVVVGHGYPVGIRYALLQDRERHAVKESKSLDILVEPPGMIIKAKDIGFNPTENETVSFVSSSGRIYQALEEPPSMAEVIPCVFSKVKNRFDLKVEAAPSQALGQVSVKVMAGICQDRLEGGGQIRLDDCLRFTVVRLTAEDSDEYSFLYWQVEGKRYNSTQLLILLEKDYNVVARFNKVGGGEG